MKSRLKFTFGKEIRARIFTPATVAVNAASTAYDCAHAEDSDIPASGFDGYEAALINFRMIASHVANRQTNVAAIKAAAIK